MDLSRLKLTEDAGGVRLSIKAVPGASRTRVVGELGGALKVAVAAAPERGQANRAIVELLAEALKVPEASVIITRGQTNPRKEVTVRGVDASTVVSRLSVTG
jgi:uncharacterized protein (TIGR00251 family)